MISLAVTPILILLTYVYIRDKYEKEPLYMLLVGLILGVFISFPIILVEKILFEIGSNINTSLYSSLFNAFISSAGTEEGIKYIMLYFLIFKNKEFNEPFDGIVYGAFISLGFAMFENILYVLNYDFSKIAIGIIRSLTAVPMHLIYGIVMGYYMGKYKFLERKRSILISSLLCPIILHGIYNFTIMYEGVTRYNLYIILILISAIITFYMKEEMLRKSPFKNK